MLPESRYNTYVHRECFRRRLVHLSISSIPSPSSDQYLEPCLTPSLWGKLEARLCSQTPWLYWSPESQRGRRKSCEKGYLQMWSLHFFLNSTWFKLISNGKPFIWKLSKNGLSALLKLTVFPFIWSPLILFQLKTDLKYGIKERYVTQKRFEYFTFCVLYFVFFHRTIRCSVRNSRLIFNSHEALESKSKIRSDILCISLFTAFCCAQWFD